MVQHDDDFFLECSSLKNKEDFYLSVQNAENGQMECFHID